MNFGSNEVITQVTKYSSRNLKLVCLFTKTKLTISV